MDDLLENPLLAPAGAGLLALLAGLGVYRLRQRKKAQADNAAPDSSLQSDSFFDANGGQQVNTNEADSTGSAMVFSPSQVDAPENVDPVAEADVYLTYGRDQQAEEILRAALKTHGERLAIHQKLLEIYAKRRDTEHFEEIATLAYDVTGGTGPDWERYCDMGLAIDPTNPLYQPGGQPGNGENPDRAALEAMRNEEIGAPMPAEAPPPVATTDLDLDLDFSLDEAAPSASIEANSGDYGDSEATLVMQAPPPEPAALSADEPPPHEEPALSMDFGSLPELDLPPAPVAPPPAPVEAVSTPADSGMLEFDLGSLSLDLGTEPEVPTEAPPPQEDPLVTKLDLAQEFVAIGDEDGARALIEEVIAESTGDMKLKAQRALSALS